MRFSIMVQLVSIITAILVAAAALFAWLQTRTNPQSPQSHGDQPPEPELLAHWRREDPEAFN